MKTLLPMHRAGVQSLAQELRSHVLCSKRKKKVNYLWLRDCNPETLYSFHTQFLTVREITNRTKKTTTNYRNRCVNDPVIGIIR